MRRPFPLIALALATQAVLLAPAQAAPMTPAQRSELRQALDQAMTEDNLYRAWFPDAATGRKAAISLHDAVLETNWRAGYLVLQLDAEGVSRLQGFGFRLEQATDFIARRNAMQRGLQLLAEPQLLGRSAAGAHNDAIPNFSCYETVEETFSAAQGFVSTYPTLATWTAVGSSWQKTNGQGGYDMRVLKLTNQHTSGVDGGPKPKLFVNAAIHAREYATAPLALAFAKQLLTGYGTDADATWILDHHEVHLMLHTNPDGRKKAETGLLWRKNTNTAYCGVNSNNRGADLNRNFSFSWNVTHGSGSSGNACDETYRGPNAASEPETQAVESYVRSLWADRRGTGNTDPAPADTSGIHIDLHSYGQLVLWPWGFTNTPSGNASSLQTLGRRFAFLNQHYPEQSIGLYPTDGTSDSVSYGELGVAAYTFEVGTNFFQSCSVYDSQIKPGNLNALLYAAKVVRTPYQTPAGPDVLSAKLSKGGVLPVGQAATLKATVNATRFSNANGTETTYPVSGASAYIDLPPWMPGAVAVPLQATDGAFDGKTETVKGKLSTKGLAAGQHIIYVQGTASGGRVGPVSAVFLTLQ
jgi:carboxypeptidase T